MASAAGAGSHSKMNVIADFRDFVLGGGVRRAKTPRDGPSKSKDGACNDPSGPRGLERPSVLGRILVIATGPHRGAPQYFQATLLDPCGRDRRVRRSDHLIGVGFSAQYTCRARMDAGNTMVDRGTNARRRNSSGQPDVAHRPRPDPASSAREPDHGNFAIYWALAAQFRFGHNP